MLNNNTSSTYNNNNQRVQEPELRTEDNYTTGVNSQENHLFGYEYTPTLCTPLKIDKYRIENLVLWFALLLGFIFGIISINTTISSLNSSYIEIKIDAWIIKGCVGSNCGKYAIQSVMCDKLTSTALTFLSMTIIHIVFNFIALFFGTILICGRVIISKYLVIIVSFISMLMIFVATVSAASVHVSPLCNDISLRDLGFKYGPAFPLLLTDFLLLFLSIVFYFLRRLCISPPRYYYI